MPRLSIRFSILQTFALLVILTVVGISVTFHIGFSKILVELYSYIARTSAQRVIERTVSFLEEPAAYNRLVADFFKGKDIIGHREEIWRHMWKQMALAPQVASFYVADQEGNFIQVRRMPEPATRMINRRAAPAIDTWQYRNHTFHITRERNRAVDYDPRGRPWYQQAEKERKGSWSDVYLFASTGEPGLTHAYPLMDQNGKLVAIFGMDIALLNLTEFVASQKVKKSGILIIINENGEAVTGWSPREWHPDAVDRPRLPLVNELQHPWVADAYNKHMQTGDDVLISRTAGTEYLGIFVNFPDSFSRPWKIAAVLPKEDVTGEATRALYRALFIAVAITLVSLLIIYIASGMISRPVKSLASEAALIKDLQLEKVAGVQSIFTETQLLNNAFIAMKNGLASFLRYVPANLVHQLIATGKEARLGGENARLAIMFTDIVGFTTISEKLSAEELMFQLSEYLDRLTRIIQKEHGTVDKYIGDSIMAFWGAPEKLEDVSFHACRAALLCQRELSRLNDRWRMKAKPEMPTCIGIHVGDAIVGNVGSQERMNYSIFGDNVNLASRLEGINRFYGTGVIISHEVYREIGERFVCRPLDIVAVKGKKESIQIYELIAEKTETISDEILSLHESFGKGFAAYLDKNWEKALKIFKELEKRNSEDMPVQLYLKRCRHFRDNPDTLPED